MFYKNVTSHVMFIIFSNQLTSILHHNFVILQKNVLSSKYYAQYRRITYCTIVVILAHFYLYTYTKKK